MSSQPDSGVGASSLALQDAAAHPDWPLSTAGIPLDPMRWRALSVIAIAQLMIILDASIVNLALPSAKAALGISDADQQWVVTGYALAFGGLLLLGGRIADYIGRKRAFVIGLLGVAGPLRSAHEELAPSVPHALVEALACVPDEWLLGEPGFATPDDVRAAYSEVLLARLDEPETWLDAVEVSRAAHV